MPCTLFVHLTLVADVVYLLFGPNVVYLLLGPDVVYLLLGPEVVYLLLGPEVVYLLLGPDVVYLLLGPDVVYLILGAEVVYLLLGSNKWYPFSYSTVSWLLLSEIFPAGIKGRAFSIATVLNWGTNLLVSLTFLDMLSKYLLDIRDGQFRSERETLGTKLS